nr:terminase small subunit [Paenibacillus alvei]
MKERLAEKEAERVASQDEVLEFLTQVMRGEVKDQLGLETPVKERSKAAELLGKRYALWTDKQQIDVNGAVQIIDDVPDG